MFHNKRRSRNCESVLPTCVEVQANGYGLSVTPHCKLEACMSINGVKTRYCSARPPYFRYVYGPQELLERGFQILFGDKICLSCWLDCGGYLTGL